VDAFLFVPRFEGNQNVLSTLRNPQLKKLFKVFLNLFIPLECGKLLELEQAAFL